MEAEGQDLLQSNVVFLLSKNLTYHFGRVPELFVLLLLHLNIVVTLQIIEGCWYQSKWNEVHPSELEPTPYTNKEEEGAHVIERGRLPKELMIHHRDQL